MAIKRTWRGWTTPENAESYRQLLQQEVRPGIEARRIPGFRRMELQCRDLGNEVEFLTTITFDSLQDVVAFMGEDYEKADLPEAARALLARWDEFCAHYEVFGE